MLFQADHGSRGVDVQQVICELNEPIDPALCHQAWRDVVARHPALRTQVEWLPSGQARQVINPSFGAECPFRYTEYAGEPAAHRGLAEYLDADRVAGFPALQGPLLRVALLQRPGQRGWMVVTYHHLIVDARSMALLFREVFDRHDALVAGDAAEMTVAPSYQNFVDWVRGQDSAAAMSFWRGYLDGVTAPTPAPGASIGSSAISPSAIGELMMRISSPATTKLRARAEREQVTLNTFVQAAWATVLHRYTGEDDVVFGAVRAGRHVPVAHAGSTVGLFITTVPVRSRVAPGLRVSDWLRGLRADWVAMRAHEHTSLAAVQRCSAVPAGRRIFETLLNFQDPAWDESLRTLGGKWAGRHFDIRSEPNYPLAVDVYAGSALTIKCFYERHRYDGPTVAEVLGHFKTVLMALAEGPPEQVADLPLLSESESDQLLERGRGAEMEVPLVLGVMGAIENHASGSPDALAVADFRAQLSYRDLNTRSNRLAHRLIKLGVGRESLVAVCLERSAEMLVAWLAVWKAGGAFVPLDPAYPAERLSFQIRDCGAAVVLSGPSGCEKVSAAAPGARIVEVSCDDHAFDNEPVDNPGLMTNGSDLAYIIYTSGSTGVPKGVQIEHRALTNLVTWHQRTYGVTAADRATHVASPAFDASIWEIWPYLAAGASVHIPTDEIRISPPLLWRWLAAQQITLSFLPTPLAEALMREEPPVGLALRFLLTGGDRLQRCPPADFPTVLVNHYGPTECTVVATSAAVATGVSGTLPTIGRPIANTTAYVLDHYGRLAPPGTAGELYLGGLSLARGYWRRPQLDAEKFVKVAVIPGASPVRLYRTGDVVRWTSTGELEFLGRSDGQVKIRGCRIELGEVEAAVRSHPAVGETVVVARPDERGELRLVAYVAGEVPQGELSIAGLIQYLREKLPIHLVPAAVVRVKAWPLTTNGKIDRSALPAPAETSGTVNGAAPSTTTERVVAKAWSDVLGRPVVSGNENFFDLGGHSLLAAQVIARLNATLPSSLSVRALFDHPTLNAFAREVEAGLRGVVDAPRPGLQPLRRRNSRAALEIAPLI